MTFLFTRITSFTQEIKEKVTLRILQFLWKNKLLQLALVSGQGTCVAFWWGHTNKLLTRILVVLPFLSLWSTGFLPFKQWQQSVSQSWWEHQVNLNNKPYETYLHFPVFKIKSIYKSNSFHVNKKADIYNLWNI